MSEEKLVYITSKGKKYHFNLSCNYVKGKKLKTIPLQKARHCLEGPCNACIRSIKKEEENKSNLGDEYKKENFMFLYDEKQISPKEKKKNNKNNINNINDINIKK